MPRQKTRKLFHDTIWDDWESTLPTRLQVGASVIITPRQYEDYITGCMLERSPHDWKRIRMPFNVENEDDLLSCEIGQILLPALDFKQKKLNTEILTKKSYFKRQDMKVIETALQ